LPVYAGPPVTPEHERYLIERKPGSPTQGDER